MLGIEQIPTDDVVGINSTKTFASPLVADCKSQVSLISTSALATLVGLFTFAVP